MTADEINRFIDSNQWTFAKTMPQSPHWYVVRAKVKNDEAFDTFVMHIREHGYKEEYEGNWYTCFDVGEFKYWTMGAPLATTIILNRAKKTSMGAINE